MDIQLKKGVLEMCVLTVLNRKECYGYELVQAISQNISISEGTIYPLLRRLKNDGLVTTYLKESTEGPPRKYYKLTIDGEKKTKTLIDEWNDFSSKVSNIVKEPKNKTKQKSLRSKK